MRDGLGEPVNLEYVLPHTGQARADILKEVDDFALYHYKLKLAYEGKVRRRFGDGKDGDAEDEQATQAVFDRVLGDVTFGELMRGDVNEIAAAESTEEESSDEESDEAESDEEGPVAPAARHPGPSQLRESHPGSRNASQTSLRRSISDRHPLSPARNSFDKARTNGPSPTPSSSSRKTERPPPSPSSASHSSSRRPPPEKRQLPKRRNNNAIKPPQLTILPDLLPLFVELARPLLTPRPV